MATVKGPYGDGRMHDPDLIRQGDTYYVFSTGDRTGGRGGGAIQMWSSTDMRHWRYVGDVFEAIPSWVTQTLGPIKHLWAPDISYADDQYALYYAGSHWGKTHSVIGLATNTTLDPADPAYHWVDRGLVIQSSPADDWNAIELNRVVDTDGRPWLTYGSFWSGIKLRRLDPSTGKPTRAMPMVHALATRADVWAIESPCIVNRDGVYYLFVSFDRCCGVDSTYRIMVGRSPPITGPYLDRNGVSMRQGGGTLVLTGNGPYRGPGGQAVQVDGGATFLVHHYYDARAGGASTLQIREVLWTPDGWPAAGPQYMP